MAFLDLLGFSAEVKRNWKSGADQVVERIMNIQKMTGLKANGGMSSGSDLRFYKARVQTVSDSIIMSLGLAEMHTDEEFGASLYAICSQIMSAWSFAINNGYTIRGGIELGEIAWTPSDLIGPALIDAYLLESRIASWSRVVCGPGLLDRVAVSPTALRHVEWGLLDVAHDGLIEVLHFDVFDRLEQDEPARQFTIKELEKMRMRAGAASSKYDPLLKRLKEPWNGPNITRQAIRTAGYTLHNILDNAI